MQSVDSMQQARRKHTMAQTQWLLLRVLPTVPSPLSLLSRPSSSPPVSPLRANSHSNKSLPNPERNRPTTEVLRKNRSTSMHQDLVNSQHMGRPQWLGSPTSFRK